MRPPVFVLRRVLCASVLATLLPLAAVGVDAGASPAQDRAEGAENRVDALTATAEEVRARLAELDLAYQQSLAVHQSAVVAAEGARSAEAESIAAESAAVAKAEELRLDVVDAMVAAYTGHGADPDLGMFATDDVEEASLRTNFLSWEADERVGLVEKHAEGQRQLAAQTRARRAATESAEVAEAGAAEQLLKVVAARGEQQQLVDDVEHRLEDALAEAAAIAEIDARAAAALAAQEQALRDAAAAAVATPVPEPFVPKASPAVPPSPPSPGTPSAKPPRTTAPPATPPPTLTGVPATATPVTTPVAVDVVMVRGIPVARQLQDRAAGLLDAAAAAGMQMSGSGYRDPAAQIALRRSHCGPTDYDVWERPAGQCSPPTARPGRSLHEQGLALDLTCSGKLITSRSNPCFEWLAANAASFGLYNLPSEPWHWSINGN